MIDEDGEQWLLIGEAARLLRVRVETIKVWRTRGKVRAHGRGAAAFVNMTDLADAEHAWRARIENTTTRGSSTP